MKGRHLRIWGFVPRRRARLAQCTNAGKPTPGRTLLTAGNSGVLGLSAVASADRQRPKSAHSAIPGAKPVRLAPRRDQRHSGRTNRTARGRRKVRLWFATACPVCTPAQVADGRLLVVVRFPHLRSARRRPYSCTPAKLDLRSTPQSAGSKFTKCGRRSWELGSPGNPTIEVGAIDVSLAQQARNAERA
jgi:hypothetical protein